LREIRSVNSEIFENIRNNAFGFIEHKNNFGKYSDIYAIDNKSALGTNYSVKNSEQD
jgi:hypothetical protein